MNLIEERVLAFVAAHGPVKELDLLQKALAGLPANKAQMVLIELSLAGELVIDRKGIRLADEQGDSGMDLGASRIVLEDLHRGSGHLPDEPLIGASSAIPVERLGLSDRIVQRLRMAHITDAAALAAMSESELLSIQGIGVGKVEKIRKALESLDLTLALKEEEERIDPEPIALSEWVAALPDGKRKAIEGRLAGETLQAIADDMDLTRERVRQLADAAFKKRPPIMEDSYRTTFDAYDFDEESFCVATSEPAETFYYLALTSKTKSGDRKPLSAIVDDISVEEVIRKAVLDGAVSTDVIFEGDRRIFKDKRSIVEYLLTVEHEGEPVAIADLLSEYEAFLSEHGIPVRGRLNPTSLRAFDACVERYDIALPTQGSDGSPSGWVRAFDPAVDLEPLREALEQAAAKNIECSTELLMREGPVAAAAKAAGIRNGTELHGVMARCLDDIEGLELGRTPMLTLGSASREEQVLSLIKEMSPAGVRELAIEYENRYGMRADTFAGTCLRSFESYLVDGAYRYVQRDLSVPEKNFVERYLRERSGYAPFDGLKDALLRAFPEGPSALPGESLTEAGFRIVDNLVTTVDVDLSQAFEALIRGADYFDDQENGFGDAIMRNNEFRAVLNKLLRVYEVVEYEPGFFLHVRVLEGLDSSFTGADLADYTDRAIDFIEPGVPYSLKSLHESGFSHRIEILREEVGMRDCFFESVLSQGYVGGRLKRTNIEGVMLFCKTPGWFSSVDVVERAIVQNGAMSIVELRAALSEEYGVDIPPVKLRSIVKRASLRLEDDIVSL